MEIKIFRLYSKNAVVLLSGKNKIEGVTQRKIFFSNFEKNEGVTKWK